MLIEQEIDHGSRRVARPLRSKTWQGVGRRRSPQERACACECRTRHDGVVRAQESARRRLEFSTHSPTMRAGRRISPARSRRRSWRRRRSCSHIRRRSSRSKCWPRSCSAGCGKPVMSDDEAPGEEARLDETLEETFPASDPPANTPETGTRVGAAPSAASSAIPRPCPRLTHREVSSRTTGASIDSRLA